MARNKKKEEERKHRREEMAKKYPMQNPRANVSTLVTGKNVPRAAAVWNKQEAASYEPAINRDVNAHTKSEPYPLRVNRYEPKKQTWRSDTVQSAQSKAVRKAIEDRENRNKAATGWQQYQIDEANKRLSRADPAFQRWKAQFGEDGLDDAFYKPAKNWSVDANNTFGYLYREDKEKAYRFAKTLNKAYRQLDEVFSAQSGSLEAKRAESGLETANTVTDWLKELDLGEKLKTAWEHHGEAQKSYGEAMKQQSENTADTAERLWENHKTNVSTLAEAQAEQAQAQTKGVEKAANNEIVQRVMNHYGEAMRSYGTALREQGEYVKDGLYLSGKYSGVTGSDQTGASIHGFRDDTSYKTPNETWTSGERQLYEQHLKNNPKEAEAYAIRTNDRHNQNQKQKKMEEARQQMNAKELLALEAGGARVLSGLKSLDGYNSLLEYSATGRISTNPEISPGEYSQLIDDTIADKIERNGNKLASDVYQFGTKAIDDIATYAVGGPALDALRFAGESVTDTLKQEKERGATDKQAAERAFLKSAGSTVIDAVVGAFFEKKYIEDAKGKDKVKNEVTHIKENITKASLQNVFDYYEQVRKHKETGFSEKQAQHIAINEVLKNGGGELLDNIGLDFAQRKFKESLERAMKRKK